MTHHSSRPRAAKRALIGLIACAGSVVCPVSLAQSSVALYGIVDSALNWSSNQGGRSAMQLISAGRGSSRWGLRGSEALGGGLAAVFGLENGFNLVNGTSLQHGREFGRLAYVGLRSARFGELTLGRQDDLMVRFLGPYSASVRFGGALAAPADDVDNRFADFKLDHTIKYFTPVRHGVQLGALLGVGGVPGSVAANGAWGLGAKYERGPFAASAVYRRIRNPGAVLFDAGANAAAFAHPVTNPIVGGYAAARDVATYGGAVAYRWKRLALNLVYTETRFGHIPATPGAPLARAAAAVRTAEISCDYQLAPALRIAAAYAYTRTENARYGQWTAGGAYLLSKRSFVYLLGSYQHASGVDSTGRAAVANLNLLSASSGPDQAVVRFGIQQVF